MTVCAQTPRSGTSLIHLQGPRHLALLERKIARVEYTEVFEALFLGQSLNRAIKVGLRGIEPRTSPLSVLRSNRLSYSPLD